MATFSAASAPNVGTSNQHFATELIVPFWLVRYTADKDLANMDRSTLKCTCSFTAGGEESKGDAVLIPILQNTKAVKEGVELLIYDSNLATPTVRLESPPQEREPRLNLHPNYYCRDRRVRLRPLGETKRLHQRLPKFKYI